MKPQNDDQLIRAISDLARPLAHRIDLKPLIEQISQARVVMLGEATHGTENFYEWRRLISEWLIVKHGFRFIAVEGDWPPCWELNQYVHSANGDNARETLHYFNRWPTWMWANTQVVRLAEWMRSHNARVPETAQAGFFGLDVYSLFESIDSVLGDLQKINPFLARRARIRYECFDPFARDERAYARSLIEFPEGCAEQVAENLREVLRLRIDGRDDREAMLFDAQQNARIVANAENYYRTMMHGDEDSWNVRDRHMLDTLEMLLDHHGPESKAIVWAHNTHIGDYRATDMKAQGQINIGGLAREKWGPEKVALVGFGTYRGEVIASHAWDGPIEKMRVPPARPGSYEAAFHEVGQSRGMGSYFLPLRGLAAESALHQTRGHRAIGVVYHPAHERFGNYVPTSLANRYDSFVFVDETQALEPLIQSFAREDIPETWPRGV